MPGSLRDRLCGQQARARALLSHCRASLTRPRLRSILYQRGLYPAESFERVTVHGMTMLVAAHPGLRTYLDAVLGQLSGTFRTAARCAARAEAWRPPPLAAWLLEGCLHKLVLVVASVASREPLERWVFNVQREDDAPGGGAAR